MQLFCNSHFFNIIIIYISQLWYHILKIWPCLAIMSYFTKWNYISQLSCLVIMSYFFTIMRLYFANMSCFTIEIVFHNYIFWNSEFISCNYKLIFCNYEFIFCSYDFISHNSEIIFRKSVYFTIQIFFNSMSKISFHKKSMQMKLFSLKPSPPSKL